MDETNRTSAFTGDDEWIVLIIFVTPADTALDLVIWLMDILACANFFGLSQFLMVKLLF